MFHGRLCAAGTVGAILSCSIGWGVHAHADVGPQQGRRATAGVNPAARLDPAARFEDAELTDVFFLDAERGWAVGDRGTIWATTDGGQAWRAQISGTSARLEAVWFVDAEHGFAVGGAATPYTHTSVGVLLSTSDGGRTWSAETKTPLPRLCGIRMFGQHGWAVGEGSSLFPGGVFSTADGGRTWSTLPSTRFESWVTGAFSGTGAGVVAGKGKRVARISGKRIEDVELGLPPAANIRRLRMSSETRGWIIGDQGLVRVTGDGGRTWEAPTGALPAMSKGSDFRAICARDENVWIAGSPGAVVWHSANGGRTWAMYPTGVSVPLAAMTFADGHRGWAVGGLGSILATRDGGRTWRVQRRGGVRVAVLAFFARAENVPLPLLVDVAGNDGYLMVVQTLGQTAPRRATAEADHEDRRAREAFTAVGAAAAETAAAFALPREAEALKASQIMADWDALHDGSAREALVNHIARDLRMWRPDVVITHAPDAAKETLAHEMNQAVLAAVERAAVDSAVLAGLGAWRVKKVFGVLPGGQRGSFELATSKLAPRLGRSLADEAARAAGLIHGQYQPQPASIRLVQLVDRTAGGATGTDLLAGISASSLVDARRTGLPAVAGEGLAALKQQAAARRNAVALVEFARGRDRRDKPGGSLGPLRVDELTRGLDNAGSAEVMTHLSQTFEETGQWDLARETYGLLAQKYATEPLGQAAVVWLVEYEASSEIRWRMRGRGPYPVLQASADSPSAKPGGRGKGASTIERLAAQVDKLPPALAAEPRVQIPLATALRRAGEAREADRRLAGLVPTRPRDAWWSCAAGETWLANPRGRPPKVVCKCRRITDRPHLDGKLDESFWSQCKPAGLADLRHPQAGRPTEVRLARDDEFLYLGIECRKAKNASYAADRSQPRQRDADLSARDRVDLFFDLDRDFATYFRLSIDDRGWGADACGRDATWDPRWFIAAVDGETSWSVEAAIPFAELTGEPPKAGSAWAVGLQRTVPGVGFGALSEDAAPQVAPEGFGYLVFE
jgi:photosystem II stability/assembly factor-like uncharacterized protein